MFAWMALIILLIGGVAYQTRGLDKFYLSNQGIDGGILNEGIAGTYTTPNPLFATSTVDLTVSRLLFNSILTYDDRGALTGDLADSVTRAENGLSYTVVLKKNVVWHDGFGLTAKDVVFTYKAIQNVDTKSPYTVSWLGVKIEQLDDYTVKFSLPAALNSFPLSLTGGILPAHSFDNVPFSELRGSNFNVHPIGTGPFKLSKVVRIDAADSIVKRQRIETVKNDRYFKGSPKLEAYVLFALKDDADIKEQFRLRTIDSAVLNSQLDTSGLKEAVTTKNIPLLAGTYIFFNTQKAPLDSVDMRQALLAGTDTDMLESKLGYPTQKVRSPFLSMQTGYDTAYLQTDYDLAKSNSMLDTLGWLRNPTLGNMRAKNGKLLEIGLTALDSSDFSVITSTLQQKWQTDIGVKLNITTKAASDMQPILLQHSYDTLLYGVSLGVDPDVFAYWHSSQAVPDRFNLSLYKSEVADRSLEAGRTRPDIDLRNAKYKPFLDAWKKDAPAIGLYQPPIFYVSRSKIYNSDISRLNSSADRFYGVHKWQVLTNKRSIL